EDAIKRQDYDTAAKDLNIATEKCAAARKLGDVARVDRLETVLKQRQAIVQSAITASKARAEQYAAAMQGATNAWTQAEDAIKRQDYDTAAKDLNIATEKCAAARKLGDTAEIDRLETVLKQRQAIVQSAINANKARAEQYAAAMQDATNAWTRAEDAIKRQDYDTAAKELTSAVEKCVAAQKLGNPTAPGQLRDLVDRRLADVNASKQSAADYASAMTASTNAWKQAEDAYTKGQLESVLPQFDSAIAQCEQARRLRPGLAADKLRSVLDGRRSDLQKEIAQRLEEKDFVTAQAAFTQGDYTNAGRLCAAHADVQRFTDLKTKIDLEVNALNDSNGKFAVGDYTFIESIKGQNYSGKAPFADLLTKAAEEKRILGELEALKQATNFAKIKLRLQQSDSGAFGDKPPFKNLADWASGEDARLQQAQQAQLSQLDRDLEILQVRFGLLNPKEAKSPEAKKERFISGDLPFDALEQYGKSLAALEKTYQNLGQLENNNRQGIVGSLWRAIINRGGRRIAAP
ncbi:MAG TPA: hypothetical protein VJA21_33910, partial [Verrucomicrobiae bacterium]